MKNCVYLFTNKINGKKYVGQTIDSESRYKQHNSTALRNDGSPDYNVPFHNAIRKYGFENFTFEILCSDLTKEEMDYWEIYYIKYYDTLVKNGKGYNVSSGGSNGNNFAGKTDEEMEEIKRKIGIKSKGRQANLGHKHSEETKEIISSKAKERFKDKTKHPMYGKKHSDESKVKNSMSRKGKRCGAEHAQAKKVAQYSLDGQLIKVYPCIKIAIEEVGAPRISSCCKGKRKTSGGYVWKYVEEDNLI